MSLVAQTLNIFINFLEYKLFLCNVNKLYMLVFLKSHKMEAFKKLGNIKCFFKKLKIINGYILYF